MDVISISTLLKLSNPGVVVVKDNSNIYILQSSNMLNSISRKLSNVSDKAHITKILPEGDPILRSLMVYRLSKEYTRNKYCVKTRYTKWDIRIGVRIARSPSYSYKAFVELYNSYYTIVLGVFDTMAEAKEWKEVYYKNGFTNYIIACNMLTRGWYDKG